MQEGKMKPKKFWITKHGSLYRVWKTKPIFKKEMGQHYGDCIFGLCWMDFERTTGIILSGNQRIQVQLKEVKPCKKKSKKPD